MTGYVRMAWGAFNYILVRMRSRQVAMIEAGLLLLLLTLDACSRRPLRLALSDADVYEPNMRALLRTAAHFCKVVVLKLRMPRFRLL